MEDEDNENGNRPFLGSLLKYAFLSIIPIGAAIWFGVRDYQKRNEIYNLNSELVQKSLALDTYYSRVDSLRSKSSEDSLMIENLENKNREIEKQNRNYEAFIRTLGSEQGNLQNELERHLVYIDSLWGVVQLLNVDLSRKNSAISDLEFRVAERDSALLEQGHKYQELLDKYISLEKQSKHSSFRILPNGMMVSILGGANGMWEFVVDKNVFDLGRSYDLNVEGGFGLDDRDTKLLLGVQIEDNNSENVIPGVSIDYQRDRKFDENKVTHGFSASPKITLRPWVQNLGLTTRAQFSKNKKPDLYWGFTIQ